MTDQSTLHAHARTLRDLQVVKLELEALGFEVDFATVEVCGCVCD